MDALGLIILLVLFLSWLLLSIIERVKRFIWFGRIRYTGALYSNVYRSKEHINHLDEIDLFFKSSLFDLPKEYVIENIISNLECIFERDIHLKGHAYEKAWGSALSDPRYKHIDFLTFAKTRRIFIDLTTIQEFNLTKKQIAQIITHEYLHHVLRETTDDADPLHTHYIWRHLNKKTSYAVEIFFKRPLTGGNDETK